MAILKHITLFLFVSFFVSSCYHQKYALQVDCTKKNKTEMYARLTESLKRQGFTIFSLGTGMRGFTAVSDTYVDRITNAYIYHRWTFLIEDDMFIYAFANTYSLLISKRGKKMGERTRYHTDKTDKYHTWYWDIRAILDLSCNSEVVFIEVEEESGNELVEKSTIPTPE